MIKKIALATTVVVIAIILYFSFGPKTITGRIVDAQKNGVSGIKVRVWQRGWGFSAGSLVWDKDYIYATQTDSAGNFRITYYRGGTSAKLQIYEGDYEKK